MIIVKKWIKDFGKRHGLNGIKHHTLFYLLFFSFLILILFWGVEYFFSSYLYTRFQEKDIASIANKISKIDDDELDEYLSEIVYKNSVCIEYMEVDGDIRFYNDATPGCLLGRNANGEIRKYMIDLRNSGDDIAAIKLVNPDYEAEAVLYGVKVDGGYVYLFTMLKNINKNYMLIKSQIVYIGIGIIIIAIIMSLYFSKIISRPINSINDKARALANGNYDIKFEHNGIKEVDELSDTLNYLESEVSKTDKYRRDLMANVSHDLKTPLTMIKAYAEMARDITYDNKEKREDNLNIIIDETDRLNILVGDILELSKLQASSDVLEIEEFDLNKEIKGILKRYDYLKETEKYNIKAIMPKEIMVKGDKKRIDQVIYNLINNAINYTGEDKTVTLKVTENKNDYLIEIIDTGKGIKKEDLPYIWDKYYKNDKNHSRNVVGTGLGLSIVKNILEQHGFEYGVNSKRGKGSTFYFMVNKSSKK